MESIINSIILIGLGTWLIWFGWVLGQVVTGLFELYFREDSPKIKYKIGDIYQDCIVENIYPNGTIVWRKLLTEIPEEEPEEKIRIPMIKFEDIPFGVVEKIPDKPKINIEEFKIGRGIGSGIQIEDNRKHFQREHEQLQIELQNMIMSKEMGHDYLRFKEDFYACLKLRENWLEKEEYVIYKFVVC